MEILRSALERTSLKDDRFVNTIFVVCSINSQNKRICEANFYCSAHHAVAVGVKRVWGGKGEVYQPPKVAPKNAMEEK